VALVARVLLAAIVAGLVGLLIAVRVHGNDNAVSAPTSTALPTESSPPTTTPPPLGLQITLGSESVCESGLANGTSVRGSVVMNPAQFFRVQVVDEEAKLVRELTMNDGRFTVPRLPAGNFTIRVAAYDGATTASVPLKVTTCAN
jgi:hypothetical protein